MSAIVERWSGSVRRELLGRIPIMNVRHLREVLAEYETHCNTHRPHRALNQASPLRALPEPVDADLKVTTLGILFTDPSAGPASARRGVGGTPDRRPPRMLVPPSRFRSSVR
ncbi:integrase core domain-containing protein [Actinoallomurus sp. NPDC052274]|uniref:integrase core domain-containing protein n=1 Tax=Actinoallomurus sp. NPDC052274 TaxID=3155420 RepID=UPI0034391924